MIEKDKAAYVCLQNKCFFVNKHLICTTFSFLLQHICIISYLESVSISSWNAVWSEGYDGNLTCKTDNATGVSYRKDGLEVGRCTYGYDVCTHSPNFSAYFLSSTEEFILNIPNFNYSYCGTYECRDTYYPDKSDILTLYEGKQMKAFLDINLLNYVYKNVFNCPFSGQSTTCSHSVCSVYNNLF